MAMMRFDARTTREVEEGRKGPDGRMVLQPRSMWNRKPYRTKADKADAMKRAEKDDDGTYRAWMIPIQIHPDPSSKQARQKEEANI